MTIFAHQKAILTCDLRDRARQARLKLCKYYIYDFAFSGNQGWTPQPTTTGHQGWLSEVCKNYKYNFAFFRSSRLYATTQRVTEVDRYEPSELWPWTPLYIVDCKLNPSSFSFEKVRWTLSIVFFGILTRSWEVGLIVFFFSTIFVGNISWGLSFIP